MVFQLTSSEVAKHLPADPCPRDFDVDLVVGDEYASDESEEMANPNMTLEEIWE